ncbi:hypothetical protein FACS1894172_13370 [Spirochaetia bacterium]|nr:hypothetical protein FACS1894164_10790 [Spirochaetia bacterium]GHU33904.1 hypothetical protein FACS1894172_13370 [Spirochaetia bacterium]
MIQIIHFGEYDWRILDVQGNNILIITVDIVEKHAYHNMYECITWAESDLWKYLNSEFYRRFTAEQQSRIVAVNNHNLPNQWYGTDGGKETTDKIFLLSLEEADRYFGNSGDYQNKRRKKYRNGTYSVDSNGYYFSNEYDNDRIASYGTSNHCWWLRSPGIRVHAASTESSGLVSVRGSRIDNIRGGVRPALWLST